MVPLTRPPQPRQRVKSNPHSNRRLRGNPPPTWIGSVRDYAPPAWVLDLWRRAGSAQDHVIVALILGQLALATWVLLAAWPTHR